VRPRPFLLLAVAMASLGQAATAQHVDAPPAEAPKELHIALSGVTLHSVVQFLSMHTGKPVLLPDRFPGDSPVDVVSGAGATVPAEKAMGIFAAVLRKAGFTMVERDTLIEIAPAGQVDGMPVDDALAEAGLAAEAVRTVVVTLRSADAAQVSAVLGRLKSQTGNVQVYPELNKLVLTDYGVNLRSMLSLVEKLDVESDQSVSDTYDVQHSSAETLQSIAQSYVTNLTASAEPALKKRLATLSVESNAATNSLVFFGHPDDIRGVKEYVRRFDVAPEAAARRYHIYDVLNRDVSDLKSTLEGVLNAAQKRATRDVSAEQVQIIADEANSQLIVIASAARYQELLPLLTDLDRPKAQVEIEAALMEISTGKLVDIGIELNTIDLPGENPRGFGGSTFGLSELTTAGRVPVLPPEGGLTAGIWKDSTSGIVALVRASQKDEDISFIAAPTITTVDNKEATVKISESREYLKSVVTPEGRTSEVTSGGFHEAAIELTITPHINEQGEVRLEIHTIIEQFLPTGTSTGGEPLTNKASREAQTEVRVPDGTTVVIGGLTRTVKSQIVRKIPLAGDIPILGALFRRREETNEELNLFIFITPRVHPTAESMAAAAKEHKGELEEKAESKGMALKNED